MRFDNVDNNIKGIQVVIGVVGPFGSGCTYVSRIIEKEHGFSYISLSDVLREYAETNEPEIDIKQRSLLQDYGNKLREEKGGNILAELANQKIDADKNCIIDSIRNPVEIDYFRNKYPDFYLFGIFAEEDIRFERLKKTYNNDRRAFEKDDKRDSGEDNKMGQQVTNCFRTADIILMNNHPIRSGNDNEKTLKAKIKDKIDVLKKDIPFRPIDVETYMSMAYAISMRSCCLKRKVGAIIVDDSGTIVSSGYNEVPITQKPCLSEFGMCYRDTLKESYKTSLDNSVTNSEERSIAYKEFEKQFKILDYCRALHGEENAIIGISKTGSSGLLSKAKLYTSTYPCNLCANKIVQVGINEIVYFEPYPMQEAKNILTSGNVIQTPFEGVTYNGYFKLMEVVD